MYLLIISIILSSTFISFISCTIPSLAPFKPNESFTIGQKFKLFCYPLAGIRPFQFEWFKNDYPLLSSSTSLSNNHYIIEQIDDASVFTIETLQQNDLGNYSCKVQNHFGYDIQSTILEIKGLPKCFFFLIFFGSKIVMNIFINLLRRIFLFVCKSSTPYLRVCC